MIETNVNNLYLLVRTMHHIFNIAILLLLSSCSDDNNSSAQSQANTEQRQSTQVEQKQSSVLSPINTKSSNEDSKITKDQQVIKIQESSDTLQSTENTIQKEHAKNDSMLVEDNASKNIDPSKITAKDGAKLSLSINDEDIVLGDKNTGIVFIEYFSPTCPHCAYYHKNVFPAIKAKYIDTNKITYVVREFVGNKQDLDAALLARCSGDQDSFMKFTNILLQQQESWSLTNKYREILTNIGQLGGVSPQKYSECLANNTLVELLISNSKIVARAPKFIGTPAFFINDIQFIGNYSIDGISETIDKYLLLKK